MFESLLYNFIIKFTKLLFHGKSLIILYMAYFFIKLNINLILYINSKLNKLYK